MASSTRIDVGGHALEVETGGAGPLAFVCLHGLADTLEIWSRLAPGLERLGRVILVNQRAHGGSEAPPGPYRRADLARDVDSLLAKLAVPRALLVGHSMGGIVAMATALDFPARVAGLVLLGTASEASERVARWYEEIARATEADGLDGMRRAVFGAGSSRRIAGDPRGLAHVTRALESLHREPLTPRLVEIRRPALVLVGEKDPMRPRASEIIARSVPDAVLEVIPDRGHWLHVEAPEIVLDSIERFVTACAAALGISAGSPV